MLKMFERSSRLPVMGAIVSRLSGAWDHIWSAGAFMLTKVNDSVGRNRRPIGAR
jgi:hypothetical protein